jgi:hypothetical protein
MMDARNRIIRLPSVGSSSPSRFTTIIISSSSQDLQHNNLKHCVEKDEGKKTKQRQPLFPSLTLFSLPAHTHLVPVELVIIPSFKPLELACFPRDQTNHALVYESRAASRKGYGRGIRRLSTAVVAGSSDESENRHSTVSVLAGRAAAAPAVAEAVDPVQPSADLPRPSNPCTRPPSRPTAVSARRPPPEPRPALGRSAASPVSTFQCWMPPSPLTVGCTAPPGRGSSLYSSRRLARSCGARLCLRLSSHVDVARPLSKDDNRFPSAFGCLHSGEYIDDEFLYPHDCPCVVLTTGPGLYSSLLTAQRARRPRLPGSRD